jgi:hypothetical protein
VEMNELAHQRQPDPGAFMGSGSWVGAAVVEAREDLGVILMRDADPCVLDGQHEMLLLLAQADVDRALGCELQCV